MNPQKVNDVIYIQLFEDDIDLREHHEVTWCNEQINKNDIKYVLATHVEAVVEAAQKWKHAKANIASAASGTAKFANTEEEMIETFGNAFYDAQDALEEALAALEAQNGMD